MGSREQGRVGGRSRGGGAEPGWRGGAGSGAEPGAGPSRGRPARRGGEKGRRARVAGHDRVVSVLPAAAGRAPFPRPLRYRPRVLKGGCQAPGPALAGPPWGLGRRALRGQPHHRLILDSVRPRPGRRPSWAAPPTHLLLTPVAWRRRATVTTWRRLGEGREPPSPPLSGPAGAERLRGPAESLLGGSGRVGPLGGRGECPNSPWTGALRPFKGLWTEEPGLALSCPGSTPQSPFPAASLRSLWLKKNKNKKQLQNPETR